MHTPVVWSKAKAGLGQPGLQREPLFRNNRELRYEMLAVHWRWRKQEASRAQVREEAPSARFHPSSSLSGSPGKAQKEKECIVLFSGQLPKAETTNLLQLKNSRPPATGRALSLGERTPRQPSPQGSRIQRYDRQDGCRIPHTVV